MNMNAFASVRQRYRLGSPVITSKRALESSAGAIRLLFKLAAIAAISAALPSPSTAAFRDVQILSVDFETDVLELFNFGTAAEPMDGWRFCSHDDNEFRRYSSSTGLNGVSINAGESLFIHFANDAPAAADNAINIDNSGIGGQFALPFDSNAYGIGLYMNSSFGSGSSIADHIQWSIGGVDDSFADERSDEAETGGVWANQSEWIATTANTIRIELADATGGILHGPGDYNVIEPSSPDFNSDGNVDGVDFVTWQGNFPILANAAREQGDANGDGAVGNEDLLAWEAAFGQAAGGTSSTAAVPEPSTVALAGLATFCATRLRRRAAAAT